MFFVYEILISKHSRQKLVNFNTIITGWPLNLESLKNLKLKKNEKKPEILNKITKKP